MSNKELFENIVGVQFTTTKWDKLGLEKRFPGITPEGRLGKYVTGLFLGYKATRDNESKYYKRIEEGSPADISLLDAKVRANNRVNVFRDIYDNVTHGLEDPDAGDDVTFESLVKDACFSRYHRTECMASTTDPEKDKLNAIALRLEGLFVKELEQQFCESLLG